MTFRGPFQPKFSNSVVIDRHYFVYNMKVRRCFMHSLRESVEMDHSHAVVIM